MYINIKYLAFIISFFSSLIVFTQNQIVKDTSFTVYAAYLKAQNNFPDIHIAKVKNTRSILEQDRIVYKQVGARNLVLEHFRKKNARKLPIIIFIHGGGWKSGDYTQLKPLAQSLAKKGYACFLIEYRLTDEAIYPAGIWDIKTAIKYIKSNADSFQADQNRIAVLGFSSGGQMATLVGTTQNNPAFEDPNDSSFGNTSIQAIINIDGIVAFKHPESEENKSAAFWLGGTYEEKPDIWMQASALTHTDENSPPILYLNSSITRFHAGRDDMISILNRHNIYNETQTFQETPHTFIFFDPWFKPSIDCITHFLKKTIR